MSTTTTTTTARGETKACFQWHAFTETKACFQCCARRCGSGRVLQSAECFSADSEEASRTVRRQRVSGNTTLSHVSHSIQGFDIVAGRTRQ